MIDTVQMNVRVPRDVAEDVRGIVNALSDEDKTITISRFVSDALIVAVGKAIDEGVQWRATGPGGVRMGRPALKETT